MSDRGSLSQPAAYPERKHRRPSAVEKILIALAYLPQPFLPKPSAGAIASRIRSAQSESPDQTAELRAVRYDLRRNGMRDDLAARALALAGRASSALAMQPDDLQLASAWLLVHGHAVELEALEGKALACALAAAVVAMSGVTVHVIVPIGYVANRDSTAMRPLFDALGLSVGCVDEKSSAEQRKEAYARDVVYCVQRELALDYLRDRLVLKGAPKAVRLRTELLTMQVPKTRHLMLRGLQFAIIDDADVVLIDAAQTPVSISADAESSQEAQWLGEALKLAGTLQEASDYRVNEGKFVELTDQGCRRLGDLAKSMAGIWQGAERREDVVKLALIARQILQKDTHYTVNGQSLQIDPQELRNFGTQQGAIRVLRLLLELKEGCAPTATRETLARIAFQRFFNGYLRSAAVASDTRGIGAELWGVYRLRVAKLPASAPKLWIALPDRSAPTREAAIVSVVARVAELRERGSPVMLVTRNPAACAFWSQALAKAGVEHKCLMGTQDEKEAVAFAEAATPGRITIIPHYGARGCSVARSEAAEKLGGLRVIFVQLLPTARHLHSLLNRTVPAGVSGSVQRMFSMDDEILAHYAPDWLRTSRFKGMRGLLVRYCQWRFDRDNAIARSEQLRVEDYMGDLFAFSGGAE